ncbi:MAG TPA: hypothetical protein DCY88_07240 [Cyanobacteria bacterium UBA11372]|nr:hypothetical protein [Cyanobacteria bacterium UBA11372]
MTAGGEASDMFGWTFAGTGLGTWGGGGVAVRELHPNTPDIRTIAIIDVSSDRQSFRRQFMSITLLVLLNDQYRTTAL